VERWRDDAPMAVHRGAWSAAWGVVALLFGAGASALWVALTTGGSWWFLLPAAICSLIAAVGLYCVFAVLVPWWPFSAERDAPPSSTPNEQVDATAPAPASREFVSSLPITTIEEAAELAKRCAATAEAIYAFLTENAMRTDEAKVLAEFRQRFETTVSGLYVELLAADFRPPDRLAQMVTSLTDVQQIAASLASRGQGFSAERLEMLSARAMKEIQARRNEEE
jgi:hypothetical protein